MKKLKSKKSVLKKVNTLVFVLIAVGLSNSCTKRNDIVDSLKSDQNQTHGTSGEYTSIIRSLGFNPDSYKVIGEYIIVEGDIMLKKEKLDLLKKSKGPQKTTQATSNIWLTRTAVGSINIYLDPNMAISGPDDWGSAYTTAIAAWNSISDCHIQLTNVTSSSNANIIIMSDEDQPEPNKLPDQYVGVGDFPESDAAPGYHIFINLDFNSNVTLSENQKVYNLVHEIGHTLAFRHTNWFYIDGDSINHPALEINHGCPTNDPNSVMNGGTALNSWVGFSYWDKYAAELVYPDWANYVQLGSAVWAGTEAMTSLNGYVYAVENSRLYQIDPSNGSYTQLGNPVWAGTDAMTSHNNYLYIVENSYFYKVDPSNGSYTQLGGQSWAGTEAMTSVGNYVYIVENSRLYQIDPSNGSYTQLGNPVWAGTDAMTSYNNYLYIVENGYFYKVDPSNGSYTQLGGQYWAGTQAMGSYVNGGIFIIQGDMYYRVSPANGTYQRFGGIQWVGTDAMTTIGNYNYVIENSRFYKVNTQ